MINSKKKTRTKTVVSLLVGLMIIPGIANASSYKTTSNLNLRTGPSTNHKSVLTIPRNANIEYLGESGLWYNVKYNNKQGYVSNEFVSKTGSVGNSASTGTKYSTTSNLNLRASTTTNSKKLTMIPKGKSVSLISKHGEWFKVQYGSTQGYVNSSYLSGVASTPATPAKPQAPAPQASGAKYTTTSNLNLRTGTSTNSSKILMIPKGQSVSLISKHGEWYKVQYGSTQGFVTSQFLINPASQKELSSFTTKFKAGESNRVFNIQRVSNAINNKVVLPGETFSFNATTGPRSYKAGYKKALVIQNGKFVEDEGGGVCQVSTTLYNTLLNAKMQIVQRHPHSKPISYVPVGRDAAVAYNYLDLKFKNNRNVPVSIKSSVSGNTITVKMYSN